MEQPQEVPNAAPTAPSVTRRRFSVLRSRREASSGQAIVEFAIVSVAFFMMVFGTIDFGRAVYMYSQLHNAVREGARYGKMNPADTDGIKTKVIDYASALDISDDNITVSCTGGCYAGCSDVTVSADTDFSAITQDLLGIGPITMSSSAKVTTE
ncbi:MAG TPA: TadE/TadG family type IV pilus assembly protein [Thermomicrobiales bacterium]|jgi:Flp pilus assembly protein TadG